MSIQKAFTVHDAQVAVWHAWRDGHRSEGPLLRHLEAPAARFFRVGLTIRREEVGAGETGEPGFGEWRMHGDAETISRAGWTVEMASVLGDEVVEDEKVSQMVAPGAPVVVVVRFLVKATGEWRVFEFHDAVFLPVDSKEDGQVMRRELRFSAGWMEEYKSGEMPGMESRPRGVIEWRHLGRCVRCWEYDPEADSWVEDAENLTGDPETGIRYVSLDEVDGGVAVSMLAAVTDETVLAGAEAAGIGWLKVPVFRVPVAGPLVMEPGWQLETLGCAEPLLLPPSGRHWEHPRLVFRVLGRIHATARGGVFALAQMSSGLPESPLDVPLRLGRLRLYPDGGWME